jgi:hypothetical protein
MDHSLLDAKEMMRKLERRLNICVMSAQLQIIELFNRPIASCAYTSW